VRIDYATLVQGSQKRLIKFLKGALPVTGLVLGEASFVKVTLLDPLYVLQMAPSGAEITLFLDYLL
jgi:hypothetical protein